MKRVRLFVSFGNKQENRKCLMACNNQYNECGRIWECSLLLHVEITSCLYGELQLFIVSSLICFYLFDVGKGTAGKDLVECYIPTAEIRELTLPDGTYVMLNSKSILLYPENLQERLEVYI